MDYKENTVRREAVVFDFLGVLVKHDGKPFVSEEHYTTFEPNDRVVDAVKKLKEQNYKIIIHSTLASNLTEGYCLEHEIPFDEINTNSDFKAGNMGKPVAKVYVDDRALCYRGQETEDLVKEIVDFKPYWK